MNLQKRSIMWITKNEPPAWKFASTDTDHITPSELIAALDELASFKEEGKDIPFRIVDVREGHERDI